MTKSTFNKGVAKQFFKLDKKTIALNLASFCVGILIPIISVAINY